MIDSRKNKSLIQKEKEFLIIDRKKKDFFVACLSVELTKKKRLLKNDRKINLNSINLHHKRIEKKDFW